jgi:hypothetical protein
LILHQNPLLSIISSFDILFIPGNYPKQNKIRIAGCGLRVLLFLLVIIVVYNEPWMERKFHFILHLNKTNIPLDNDL